MPWFRDKLLCKFYSLFEPIEQSIGAEYGYSGTTMRITV